jgi:hypothetical protein
MISHTKGEVVMKKINTFLLIFGVILSTVVMPAVQVTTGTQAQGQFITAEPNSNLEVEYVL